MAERFVALDVETATSDWSSICQVGIVRFEGGEEVDSRCWLIDPGCAIAERNRAIHGIDDAAVHGRPTFPQVYSEIIEFVGQLPVAAHAKFDNIAIVQACGAAGLTVPSWEWIDTCAVARSAWQLKNHKLITVAEHLGITFRHHDALEDARAAGLILVRAIAEGAWPIGASHRGAVQAAGCRDNVDAALLLQLIEGLLVTTAKANAEMFNAFAPQVQILAKLVGGNAEARALFVSHAQSLGDFADGLMRTWDPLLTELEDLKDRVRQ